MAAQQELQMTVANLESTESESKTASEQHRLGLAEAQQQLQQCEMTNEENVVKLNSNHFCREGRGFI